MNNAEVNKNIVNETGEEPRVIEMMRGIPGFERIKRYCLKSRGQNSPFGILQSLEEGGPSFIVVNPFLACTDYEPVIPDREARLLEIENPSQAALLVIVTIRQDASDVTVNLRAPLVINSERNLAAQVVLDDDVWPVRHSIMTTA